MDNYIIGHLHRLGDQKDRCRVTFKLRSQGKTEIAMQRWRKRIPGKGNQGFQGEKSQSFLHCSQQSLPAERISFLSMNLCINSQIIYLSLSFQQVIFCDVMDRWNSNPRNGNFCVLKYSIHLQSEDGILFYGLGGYSYCLTATSQI